ncbi:MAG: lysophospholipid acyltransferase family protein [Prevotella sp.]|nr:lysophospholipid acyltransferase family protein [Prevotella sp.]MBR7054580.1 lysophospholipid acyltransferase family protein [Prevotella sp.]
MKIAYRITRALLYPISLLPFRVLYVISDCLYFLIYHVAGYRKRLVRHHLETCFPEKDKKELKSIERGFYHFLCDYFLEALKLLSISKEEMLKHVELRGMEDIQRCFDEGQTCAAMMGHYGNWEYLTTLRLGWPRHPDAIEAFIYHPLSSDVFDQLFIDLRQHFGGVCVPKKDILRYLLNCRREGTKLLTGYLSDQTPKWTNIHLWLDFLGHDTPVFTNGEKLMRKMNNAIFYVDMSRPKRGYYIADFKLITRTPNEMEENAITRRFFELLEENIRRDPRFYLWTHNRWKRTREEFDRRFKVVNGKVIPKGDE